MTSGKHTDIAAAYLPVASAATISPPPTRRAASTARLTRLLLSSDLLRVAAWVAVGLCLGSGFAVHWWFIAYRRRSRRARLLRVGGEKGGMAQPHLPAALQVAVPPAAAQSNGGFGVVVFGTHTPTNEPVAVKVQERVQVGLHEAAILQHMGRHARVVRFVNHHVEDSRSFLVMEAIVPPHEWFAEVGNGPLPLLPDTQAKFAQALEGVAFIHSRGVVHLDLKLENIMVRADGSIVLIDFGLAQILPAGAPPPVLHDFKGSVAYAAPGVWAGAYDGVKSDVWSLGVCLFTACSGFFPFVRARHDDPLFQHVQQVQANGGSTVGAIFAWYHRLVPFPPALVELLDRLLLIHEQTRCTVGEAIASVWVQSAPPPPPPPPQPQQQQVLTLAQLAGAQYAVHSAQQAGYETVLEQAMAQAAALVQATGGLELPTVYDQQQAAGGLELPTVDAQLSGSTLASSTHSETETSQMSIETAVFRGCSATDDTEPTSPAYRSLEAAVDDSAETGERAAPPPLVRQRGLVILFSP